MVMKVYWEINFGFFEDVEEVKSFNDESSDYL
jgi:hypothetical protein